PLEQRAEAEIERLRSQANMCNAKLQTIELRASAAERQNAPPQALVELLNLIRPGLGNLLH
ncbi:MAG TPA: hypothetical protein VKT29_17470, partial [Terriglobales bacterium]|nr:hypothetical protein [Terriglobales bacterium]